MDKKQYILDNYKTQTVVELSASVGSPWCSIIKWCKELGVRPIRRGERTKQLITAYHQTLTMGEIAAKLCVTENLVRIYCRQLKITCKRVEAVKKEPVELKWERPPAIYTQIKSAYMDKVV